MPGYKQTIQEHNPVMFITFDGDPYDPVTRQLTSTPATFMDESGYSNNGILHNESSEYPAYRMGFPSMVEMEPTDQSSVSFGWYGHQPGSISRWPKTLIEVPHQTHMNLSGNLGSFSVSFLLYKASDEQHWRTVEQAQGNSSYSATLIRPLVRKGGVFHIWYQDNWASADQLRCSYPGGELVWTIPTTWFYARNHVITFTWDVKEPTPNQFVGVATLYVNGHIYATATHNYSFSTPSSTSIQPVEIAGTILSGGDAFNDRATTNTMLDQIFILNKALSPDEVGRLYKKARPYDSAILFAQPSYYWPMSDEQSLVSSTMIDMTGNLNGTYLGDFTTQVVRDQLGPPRVAGMKSVYFMNGGMAKGQATSMGMYTPVFNPSGNFTVEFWARIESTTRGVLFSIQRDNTPFNGILIEANVRNNVASPGQIQASVSQGAALNNLVLKDNGLSYNFVDSQFHHFCLLRRGNRVELWIDGILHSGIDLAIAAVPSPGPGQMYLMGMMPGNLNTTGYMAGVVIYNYALDPHEVRMRNLYSLTYRIKGNVTLQGNPHQATVRALIHRTGELEREVLSDPSSGDYNIELYSNTLIDLMALNKQDRNIRYRVYGPITPTAYEDLA